MTQFISLLADEYGGHEIAGSLSGFWPAHIAEDDRSNWAYIPDGLPMPNLPYGTMTTAEIDGVPTVTEWIPGEIPDIPAPEEEENLTEEELLEYICELEEQIALYELGLTEEDLA